MAVVVPLAKQFTGLFCEAECRTPNNSGSGFTITGLPRRFAPRNDAETIELNSVVSSYSRAINGIQAFLRCRLRVAVSSLQPQFARVQPPRNDVTGQSNLVKTAPVDSLPSYLPTYLSPAPYTYNQNMQDTRNYNEIVAKNIRLLRKKNGYSQEYLAELVDRTREHINRLETGKETIEFTTFIKLAEVFGVSLDELAEFEK